MASQHAAPPPRHGRSSKHRLSRILISHLSQPLLSSLALLPILPASQRHLIFEILPFAKSLRAILRQRRHRKNRDIQQWLSYWTIYAFVRFLETARLDLSTGEQRWRLAKDALDLLPNIIRESLARIWSTATQHKTAAHTTINDRRSQTLASQLAGSATRWTVIKTILLFYSMDEQLQGARWIMDKVVSPIFGLFTGLDDVSQGDNVLIDDEALNQSDYRSPKHTARRSLNMPEQHKDAISDAAAQATVEETLQDNEPRMQTPELSSTPESSISGGSVEGESEGRYVEEGNVVERYTHQQANKILLIKSGLSTWPSETIAVEGNHWVQ